MHIPLPGGAADELMWHLKNCPECSLSKIIPGAPRCNRGQQLVRHTLEERHGKDAGR